MVKFKKRIRKLKKKGWLLILTGPLLVLLVVFWFWGAEERKARQSQEHELRRIRQIENVRRQLSTQLGPFFLHNQYLKQTELRLQDRSLVASIDYTFNEDLQKEADRLLKAYKPDFGAIVIMDATNGKILAMSSYQKGSESPVNLNLRGGYPAASVFKIVTATAALDKYGLTPDTLIMFNGGNHTLYRKNVMYNKVNRWTREMSLRDAFARSINTVFGRLTLEHLRPEDLEEYAIRFGFNTHVESDLPFDMGFTQVPKEKSFHLAEIASGFNRVTTMSPLQGAMIAASVAAGGVMRVPYIVDKIRDPSGHVIFESEPVTAAVTMSGQGAERLKALMEATIYNGTSKKSFRPLIRDKKFRELELGGKTGSLMGENPRGKVDWFVGYAIGDETDRLAVAALTINVKYWTVKSSYLAQDLFKSHFKEQFSERNARFFNPATGQ